MQTTILGTQARCPTGPFDYGDDLTIGLQLKRADDDVFHPKDNGPMFAVYAGKLTVHTFVPPVGCELLGVERFSSLAEMHKRWRLD